MIVFQSSWGKKVHIQSKDYEAIPFKHMNCHKYDHMERKCPYKLQKNQEEDKGFKWQKAENIISDPQMPNKPKKV